MAIQSPQSRHAPSGQSRAQAERRNRGTRGEIPCLSPSRRSIANPALIRHCPTTHRTHQEHLWTNTPPTSRSVPKHRANRKDKWASDQIVDHAKRSHPIPQIGVHVEDAHPVVDPVGLDSGVHQHNTHNQFDQGMFRKHHEDKRGHQRHEGGSTNLTGVMPVS